MAFGVYVHIPYCLQRCVYCDFATFEVNDSRVGPAREYIDLLCREIESRHSAVQAKYPVLDTLYFGGGTPSLLEPKYILAIKKCLSQVGFRFSTQLEWTIEINPATIDTQKLTEYQEMGINRFSLGVQSFSDEQLKKAGRRHTAQQTRETLRLLYDLNFSMDLLFALPHQTLESLERDLTEFLAWKPKHISPYCLTVPESNPMAANRPLDEIQVKMFEVIRAQLTKAGYIQYEISNYALPGFESRHNELYWQDENYWGVGLSSHSYLKTSDFGVRFWNPPQYSLYKEQVIKEIEGLWPYSVIPASQTEHLKVHEALTDYCHTALRTGRGLDRKSLELKFSQKAVEQVDERLRSLPKTWLAIQNNSWKLTHEGQVLSNQVFEKIYFDTLH